MRVSLWDSHWHETSIDELNESFRALSITEDQIDFLIRNVESSIHNLSCVICFDSAPIIAGSY